MVYQFGVKITLHGSPRRKVYSSSINKVSLDQAFFFTGLIWDDPYWISRKNSSEWTELSSWSTVCGLTFSIRLVERFMSCFTRAAITPANSAAILSSAGIQLLITAYMLWRNVTTFKIHRNLSGFELKYEIYYLTFSLNTNVPSAMVARCTIPCSDELPYSGAAILDHRNAAQLTWISLKKCCLFSDWPLERTV